MLFSHGHVNHDLGMLDARASEVHISIGDVDFDVKQSPSALQSSRQGGTTGAVVWRTTIALATAISQSLCAHVLNDLFDDSSTVIELGSGIAGILPIMFAPRVARYIATDQQYTLKLLQQNIRDNMPSKRGPYTLTAEAQMQKISVTPLDWESDDISSWLKSLQLSEGVDLVIACDCIYNYALIEPFNQTCVDICKARQAVSGKPTVCLVAQPLRQPDVFQAWMQSFLEHFTVYNMQELFTSAKAVDHVVHLCVLRSEPG